MKTIILAGILGCTFFVGFEPTSALRPSQGRPGAQSGITGGLIGSSRFYGVRAEYVARDTTHGQVDTEVVIQNTNAIWPFRIGDIIVLGRHGLATTLRIHKGLSGGLVPPLGQIVIPIDSSIGVVAGRRSGPSPRDVATVVVGIDARSWEHAKVTAVVKQWEPSRSTDGFYAMRLEQSFRASVN